MTSHYGSDKCMTVTLLRNLCKKAEKISIPHDTLLFNRQLKPATYSFQNSRESTCMSTHCSPGGVLVQAKKSDCRCESNNTWLWNIDATYRHCLAALPMVYAHSIAVVVKERKLHWCGSNNTWLWNIDATYRHCLASLPMVLHVGLVVSLWLWKRKLLSVRVQQQYIALYVIYLVLHAIIQMKNTSLWLNWTELVTDYYNQHVL